MQADLENVADIGALKMQAIRWGHGGKGLDASKLLGDRHLFVQVSGESREVSQCRPRASHEKFRGRGYETIAVAMSYDPPAYVVNFAQTRRLPFAVAIDNTGVVAKAWGDVNVTPTTFLLNKRGVVVKRFVGKPDFAELNLLIDRLLSES